VADKQLHFYFDYLSGYAYIAWVRLRSLLAQRSQLELIAHPTLLAGLLDHWGQLGPAEIPPKREWVFKDGYRLSVAEGFEFCCPKYHPFNPLHALRVSLREVSGEAQLCVIDTLWTAGWGKGCDYGDPTALVEVLTAAGLDGQGLIEKTRHPAVKQALRASTDEAIGHGVFGVPSFIVDGELVWGSDRMEQVEMLVDGRDTLDKARVRTILDRPGKAQRR
jgi:2-hydroxychromene-2-carboxylate isomerase